MWNLINLSMSTLVYGRGNSFVTWQFPSEQLSLLLWIKWKCNQSGWFTSSWSFSPWTDNQFVREFLEGQQMCSPFPLPYLLRPRKEYVFAIWWTVETWVSGWSKSVGTNCANVCIQSRNESPRPLSSSSFFLRGQALIFEMVQTWCHEKLGLG